jgi:hypothetical protein
MFGAFGFTLLVLLAGPIRAGEKAQSVELMSLLGDYGTADSLYSRGAEFIEKLRGIDTSNAKLKLRGSAVPLQFRIGEHQPTVVWPDLVVFINLDGRSTSIQFQSVAEFDTVLGLSLGREFDNPGIVPNEGTARAYFSIEQVMQLSGQGPRQLETSPSINLQAVTLVFDAQD